jgi:hypothetical protein
MKYIVCILLTLLLSACTNAYGQSENTLAQGEAILAQNEAKWISTQPIHYTMEVDAYSPDMPWTIEVQNGKVISAVTAQGYSMPIDDSVLNFTVSALFKDIESRYEYHAPLIRISYNPTYGYPEDINIIPYSEPCCQGYQIHIKNFQVLPDVISSPTPYTPRMTCSQHASNGAAELWAKSDFLWEARFFELNQIDTKSFKIVHTLEYPDFFMGPGLMIVTNHGVWLDGLVEGVYYDGMNWTKFEYNRSEGIDEITPPIYLSQDNRYWFLTRAYLLIYDFNQNSIQAYVQDSLGQDESIRFVVAKYNNDFFATRIASTANIKNIFSPGWMIVLDQTLESQSLKKMPSISITEYADRGVGPDGSIWMADAGNMYRFNPTIEQWTEFNPRDSDPALNLLTDLTVAPNGSIFLTDGRFVVRVIPLSATTNEANWVNYDSRDGFESGLIGQISVDPDNTIWINVGNILNQCKLLENN